MKYDEIGDTREMYQQRMDELAPPGVTLGSVLLPPEWTPEEDLETFHELMSEHGYQGIVYAQEALNQNEHYFEETDAILADFVKYKKRSDRV